MVFRINLSFSQPVLYACRLQKSAQGCQTLPDPRI